MRSHPPPCFTPCLAVTGECARVIGAKESNGIGHFRLVRAMGPRVHREPDGSVVLASVSTDHSMKLWRLQLDVAGPPEPIHGQGPTQLPARPASVTELPRAESTDVDSVDVESVVESEPSPRSAYQRSWTEWYAATDGPAKRTPVANSKDLQVTLQAKPIAVPSAASDGCCMELAPRVHIQCINTRKIVLGGTTVPVRAVVIDRAVRGPRELQADAMHHGRLDALKSTVVVIGTEGGTLQFL